jgi:hypothetical protein
VSNPPENDPTPPDGSNGRAGGIAIARAVIVIAAFVTTTVLVLGVIHPPAAKSAASGSPPTPSTSTSQPGHPASTTSTVPPSQVHVLVANASGVPGAAATVTNRLQVGGWSLLPPVNASTKIPTSQVYYVSGQQQAADSIAASLHLPASAVAPYTTAAPIASIGTAEVVVVVGPDLASPGSSTTTTATTARTTTPSTVN